VIGTLAVDGWAVTFGTARRGLRAASIVRENVCNKAKKNIKSYVFLDFEKKVKNKSNDM